MAEALRDCMIEEECMSDGTRTLKQCLKLREYAHECRVRSAALRCVRVDVVCAGKKLMIRVVRATIRTQALTCAMAS